MLAVVIFVWRVAVALKLCAAARMAWTRTARRFPFVCAWLTIAALRSLVLMFGPWPRHEFYIATAPLLVGLELAASAEVIYQATKAHRFGRLGALAFGLAALVAVGFDLLTRLALVPANLIGIDWPVLIQRRYCLGMLIVLAATVAALRWFADSITPRPMAYRALLLMLAYAAETTVLNGLNVATRFRYPALTNLLPVALDGALAIGFGWWMMAARGRVRGRSRHVSTKAERATSGVRMDRRESALRQAVASMR